MTSPYVRELEAQVTEGEAMVVQLAARVTQLEDALRALRDTCCPPKCDHVGERDYDIDDFREAMALVERALPNTTVIGEPADSVCTCGGGLGHKAGCPGYAAETAHVDPRPSEPVTDEPECGLTQYELRQAIRQSGRCDLPGCPKHDQPAAQRTNEAKCDRPHWVSPGLRCTLPPHGSDQPCMFTVEAVLAACHPADARPETPTPDRDMLLACAQILDGHDPPDPKMYIGLARGAKVLRDLAEQLWPSETGGEPVCNHPLRNVNGSCTTCGAMVKRSTER